MPCLVCWSWRLALLLGGPDAQAPLPIACFATPQAPVVYVELARSPAQLARGLMYRHSLPPNAGMLFVFADAQPRAFWMRHTPLPLDMIFIGANHTVVHIVEQTVPQSSRTYASAVPAQYVLEVNAGWVRRWQVGVGTQVGMLGLEQT